MVGVLSAVTVLGDGDGTGSLRGGKAKSGEWRKQDWRIGKGARRAEQDGTHGFPCCSKGSVEIAEMRGSIQAKRLGRAWGETFQLEADALEQKLRPKVDLAPDPDPDPDLEMEPVPALLESELYPALKPEAELDTEAKWNKEAGFEGFLQPLCRIESVHSNMGLPVPQTFRPWSLNSSHHSSTEEKQVSANHHSISAQTSKHLFWANKLIQTSEHSLQRAIHTQLNTTSASQLTRAPGQAAVATDTLCETFQLEADALEQKLRPKVDLAPDPDPDPDLEMEPVPALLESELYPALKPEAELDTEAKWNKEAGFEGFLQPLCRIESVHSNMGLPVPQTFRPWSLNSSHHSSTEEKQVSANHHSISAQTSKHLFWANKLIQTSEHSLQRAIHTQLNTTSASQLTRAPGQAAVATDTLCSEEQLQTPNARSAPPAASSQAPPSPLLPSDLPPPIGLTELVIFASALAVASSSRMDLPSLEHMMKAPPQQAPEASTEPVLTTVEGREPEKHAETLLEKPREAGAPQKSWSQEGKKFPHSYLDFSKPGIRKATIEGEMQLLQPPVTSPPLQGVKEDSVP
nr:spermatogenesis-associated protein 32 [Aotus nancymaae]